MAFVIVYLCLHVVAVQHVRRWHNLRERAQQRAPRFISPPFRAILGASTYLYRRRYLYRCPTCFTRQSHRQEENIEIFTFPPVVPALSFIRGSVCMAMRYCRSRNNMKTNPDLLIPHGPRIVSTNNAGERVVQAMFIFRRDLSRDASMSHSLRRLIDCSPSILLYVVAHGV